MNLPRIPFYPVSGIQNRACLGVGMVFHPASHPKSVSNARLALGFRTHPIFRHTFVGNSPPHGFRSVNHEIWYEIFYFHCSFILVSMFQFSTFCIFESFTDWTVSFVFKIFSLEQDLVEFVLLLSNSLNFHFSSLRKSRENPTWAWRDERYFSVKSHYFALTFRTTVRVPQMTWGPFLERSGNLSGT